MLCVQKLVQSVELFLSVLRHLNCSRTVSTQTRCLPLLRLKNARRKPIWKPTADQTEPSCLKENVPDIGREIQVFCLGRWWFFEARFHKKIMT